MINMKREREGMNLDESDDDEALREEIKRQHLSRRYIRRRKEAPQVSPFYLSFSTNPFLLKYLYLYIRVCVYMYIYDENDNPPNVLMYFLLLFCL